MDLHSGGAARFDVFGASIVVRAGDVDLADRIHASLREFHRREGSSAAAEFHLRRHPGASRVGNGRQVHSGSLLVIADRHKLVAASLGATPWQIHVDAYGRTDEYVYYYLFEPLLHMVLKRHGLLHWHGAAVQSRGRLILIVGESGSGKSTTALALLLGGFRFVADDELFLVAREDGIGVRSNERHIHFTEATAELLRGLPDATELPRVRRGRGMKRRLDAGTFPKAEIDGGVHTILFPRVAGNEPSRLRELPAKECLHRLLAHAPKEYPAVIADPPSLQRQLDTCATLATSARAFDLVLGRDVERVAALVDEVAR